MKTKLLFTILAFALLAPANTAFAAESKLTKEQSAKLSESCGTIRQNLKNLQRTDSRARTYFGSIYETVSTKYLKSLNLRLVNNDLANSELLNLQASIAAARADFAEDFITYSKSLENLIAIDCRLEPENFYKKLLETRKKRATVAADVKLLNNFLSNIVKNAEKLKELFK
ncbi:hypothetical protein IIZ77_00480 [Candidatus Saccharibacteria bacterium]|nr:hypothetical protein [Candidatus Saccharibacteria bacterium]